MDTNELIPLLPEMAVFVKVVELESFSKAAHHLGVAPSSVSRTVLRLEAALAEKLLERTTRKMRLTPIGQEVFVLCKDMLDAAKLAVYAAQSDRSEVSGTLRVAAPKALSRQVLMPIVMDFINEYPRVKLQLKVADHYIDPIGDEVDILIQITHSPTEGLISRTLGHCQLLMVAAQSYLNENGTPVHPEQLEVHNCIRLGENPRDCLWEFSNGWQKHAVNVSGSFACNHSEIRRESVLRGVGISVFPEFAIRPYIERGEVVAVLPDWHVSGNYQGDIVAQYAQSKFVPTQIKAFIDYVEQRLPQCF
ncbi:LysR family transcriptional regulator [Vibrio sp. WXL103]|uniref:LysR family transcriptional regulator n=1 Tax=unclassified Vibrio TaxID=2614977 RepID=UPI003EC67263